MKKRLTGRQTIRITTRPGCGDEIEDLEVMAYVTEYVDWSGKRTILIDGGSGVYREWFLFDDEWTRA